MPDTFVAPAWVAGAEATVVDVRRPAAYEAGHLPGAVSVPFESVRDPAADPPGHLPDPDGFAATLRAAGVAPDDRVVAYDADRGVHAARVVLTAEAFGHDPDRLHVLEGDVAAWRRERPTTTAVPDPEPTAYDAAPRAAAPLVDAAALEAELDRAVVVDTRDPVEYRAVHLPGAVNLRPRDLLADDGRGLKPPAELRAVLADHGVTPDRPVRLYCNTARRVSFVYAVLRDLGFGDVAVYEGGIDAWAADGRPVETSPPA